MSKSDEEIYLAAIEGGGTTFVVSVARVIKRSNEENDTRSDDDDDNILQIGPTQIEILHTTTIPPKHTDTGEILHYTPTQILEETCAFLSKHLPPCGYYSAVGIATFGPAGVNRTQTHDYGTILSGSPKKEWRNVDLLSPIATVCGLDKHESMKSRVGFDTDVNAPAVAEFRHRCYLQQKNQSQTNSYTKPLTSLSYITIGTGVGVGLILNSQPIHGLLHPEGGHVAIQPLQNDTFTEGYSWGKEKSPYGGVGTVEGVASSVALTERYLQMENKGNNNIDHAQTREVLSTLSDDHEVWEHASNAIANLCVSILLLTSCEKIVLGGGIMKRTVLYDMIRKRVWTILNGYLDSVDELSSAKKLDNVIVESSWEKMGSGLVGAFALAIDALEKTKNDDENGSKEEKNQSSQVIEKKGNEDVDEQQIYTSGVLAGICLSLGCVVLSSFFGRGIRHRH